VTEAKAKGANPRYGAQFGYGILIDRMAEILGCTGYRLGVFLGAVQNAR
jgi:hypothetical protein